MARIFVTGGTGYVGRRLVRALLELGHEVCVLTRQESVSRVPAGAGAVVGDALDAASFQHALRAGDTLVHLVGTPHPSPAKAAEFRRVDLPSILASVAAARHAGAAHVVYVSVAQPAPVMQPYIAVRVQGEAALAACPELLEIDLTMPNRHHLLVDLTPFGLENRQEIFLATSEPHGLIRGTVARS